jgi:hypothetical protein
MSWLQLVIAGAMSAFATWLACWWWYRRKLRALRRRLELELPAVPPSELTAPRSSPEGEQNHSVDSVDELERTLNESNTKWEKVRPFLDTSPLPHVVEDKNREVASTSVHAGEWQDRT